jgi:hypothetical protein
MKRLRVIRDRRLYELSQKIQDNLPLYRTGSFADLTSDISTYYETNVSLDLAHLADIFCSTVSNRRDLECCASMYSLLPNLPLYLARDARGWIYLTHTILLDYTRARWPIPDDDVKAVNHIRTHFFSTSKRGLERDNAASRLWWMAHLCHGLDGISFMDALEALLRESDVRASIIERPTVSQNRLLRGALLRVLSEALKDRKDQVFERNVFRSVMGQINLEGGTTLLELLTEPQVNALVQSSVKKALGDVDRVGATV